MTRIFERDMRRPVCLWLHERGYTPLLECWTYNNCDIAGVTFTGSPRRIDRVAVVELKLRDVAGVLRQCERHIACGYANVVYAALPCGCATRAVDVLARANIGVLEVDVTAGMVRSLYEPTRCETCSCKGAERSFWRRRNQWLDRLDRVGMRYR